MKRKHSAALKILFFSFLPFISPLEDYLFESGRIVFKEIDSSGKHTKHVFRFQKLLHIDHHLHPNAVGIKVTTKRIPDLYEGAIKNFPQLKVLSLPKCGIEKISANAFQNLPQLEKMFLQDNAIEIVEEGIFNFLSVRKLFLQRNLIRIIRDGAFDNLPNLAVVHLNSNRISVWNPLWFKNAPMLTDLYFRRNLIAELPSKAFVNVNPQHEVDGDVLVDAKIFLSHNRIASVHPEAFGDLEGLYHLYLDRNAIGHLDRETFSRMTQLQVLSLYKNNLSSLDKSLFVNLKEPMTELDLGKNRLECVPDEIVAAAKMVNLESKSLDCLNCLQPLTDKFGEEHKIHAGDMCEFEQDE